MYAVPILAGLSALALCLFQNIKNPLQAEQSKLEQIGTNAVSILISLILVHCIGALLPVDSPVGTPSYPISVAVVAVAVSVLTALLGGLLPALKAAKLEPALALR